MAPQFKGKALPLSDTDLAQVCQQLETKAAHIWAVLHVETTGCGFLPDRRPKILFERHKFSEATHGKFDGQHPEISNPKQGGYGLGGPHQYDRLREAIALDEVAALNSTSWGIAQILGSNAKIVGYNDASTMVSVMIESEGNQLQAMANFLKHNKLDAALRSLDWRTFANGYNGRDFEKNKYDKRLEAAFAQYSALLPDLNVRAAQVFLTYLDVNPGTIDGVLGPRTKSALEQFQLNENLAVTGEIDAATVQMLRARVG